MKKWQPTDIDQCPECGQKIDIKYYSATEISEADEDIRRALRLSLRCIDQLIQQNKISPGWYFTFNNKNPNKKNTIGNFRVELKRVAGEYL